MAGKGQQHALGTNARDDSSAPIPAVPLYSIESGSRGGARGLRSSPPAAPDRLRSWPSVRASRGATFGVWSTSLFSARIWSRSSSTASTQGKSSRAEFTGGLAVRCRRSAARLAAALNGSSEERAKVVRELVEKVIVAEDTITIRMHAGPLLAREVRSSAVEPIELKVVVGFKRRGVETKLILPGRAQQNQRSRCDPALIKARSFRTPSGLLGRTHVPDAGG
jgi:hypothetical protein